MATDASDVLLIPTEVCETILDFIADTSRHTLLSCALVSRVWLPRCRFHLCGVVILRSHEALLSFSLLLSSSPQYATLLHTLSLCAKGSRKADSWVASVPLMLPPLPNLSQFKIHGFDLAYQHPSFFRAYSKFKLTSPQSKLSLVNISYHSFYQIARLARTVHASELELDSRSLYLVTSDGVFARSVSLRNIWLTTVSIHIRSWMEMKQVDWDWILACPKLTFCALDADVSRTSDEGFLLRFSPQNAHVWSHICRVVRFMSPRPKSGARLAIRLWSVHIKISAGSQAQQPTLHIYLEASDTLFYALNIILSVLLVLSSCGIATVDLAFEELVWMVDRNMLKGWEKVDHILSLDYPFLRHLSVSHPKGYCPSGTDCTFHRDMFPRAIARGVLKAECTTADCTR